GEELGVIGAFAVMLLFGALALKGFKAAEEAPDRFGTLLAAGLVAWIATEAVINIGAVLGLLPVTGIPLPFVSYGGTSMVITLAAAGILVNIARQERAVTPTRGLAHSPSRKGSSGAKERRPAATGTARRSTRHVRSR
ncbi:MAG: FtsW/RodA/SpoVE family cell cycle protein, partial [Actinomycetes bacterium]